MTIFKKIIDTSRHRKTLLFVSIITGFFTLALCVIFIVQDYDHKKMDDQRTTTAVAKMLSYSMRLHLFSYSKNDLVDLAENAIATFGVSKVQVLLPDGTIFVEHPSIQIPEGAASSRAPITVSQTLSPDAIITGDIKPDEPLGVVVVYSTGKDRLRELYLGAIYIFIFGVLFWLASTYVAYLIMRKVTESFDMLVDSISDIEKGLATSINLDPLKDEAAYIGQKINVLSKHLIERETQNVALQRELTKEMEERARAAEKTMQDKLIMADKMSTLGLLVGCMGHEINNPNAIIRLQNDTIRRITEDADPFMRACAADEDEIYLGGMPFEEARRTLFENINGIDEQTHRIEKVIMQLRQYATADIRQKSLIGLDEVILGTMVLLAPQMRQYRGTVTHILQKTNRRTDSATFTGPDRRAKIWANQFSLQQILVNLITNAMRATSTLGEQGVININIESTSDNVTLIVTDNGVGIPEEDIHRLTDPYFSRHIDEGGTGLGLFISQKIVVDHNGTIEFKSKVGEGTSVHATFPAVRNQNG